MWAFTLKIKEKSNSESILTLKRGLWTLSVVTLMMSFMFKMQHYTQT